MTMELLLPPEELTTLSKQPAEICRARRCMQPSRVAYLYVGQMQKSELEFML